MPSTVFLTSDQLALPIKLWNSRSDWPKELYYILENAVK